MPETASQAAPSAPARHFIWLDWLRFLAAFVVLVFHARGFAFVEYRNLQPASQTKFNLLWFVLTRVGHEAVLVFFVLSGFLVGGKLVERIARRSFEWRAYALDRATRIIVPLVPAVLFAFAVDALHGHPPTLLNALGTLFLLFPLELPGMPGLMTISPLWSLAYEVWFYILAGAFAVALIRRPVPPWGALLLLCLGFVAFTKLLPSYLFCWMLGSLAYLYPRPRFSWRETTLALSIMFVGVAMFQASTATLSGHSASIAALIGNGPLSELVISAGCALLIRNLCTVTQERGRLSWGGKLGEYLAAFSYTLYLVHFPLLTALHNLGYAQQTTVSLRSVSVFVGMICLSLVVAFAFYWVFERNTPVVRRALRAKVG